MEGAREARSETAYEPTVTREPSASVRSTQAEQPPPPPAAAQGPGTAQAPEASFDTLAGEDVEGFRRRWEDVQARFVDDPRDAAEQADALVGELMDRLARLREEHRAQLRRSLEGDEDTERLRVALQQYRGFLQSLLGS
jgi:predicted lipid-binding transport protein (Tim44 family)